MGLLKFILGILLFYYVIKLILRLAITFLIPKYYQKSARSTAGNTTNRGKPGETVITKKPPKQKASSKIGEYVDYEEINE